MRIKKNKTINQEKKKYTEVSPISMITVKESLGHIRRVICRTKN